MALTATGCIHRGVVNLRANWELVFFQWLQGLLVTVLIIVGLVPPLAVLGWSSLAEVVPSAGDWQSPLRPAADLLARGWGAWWLLFVAFLLAGSIWLLAMLVYCYFQGGILGVLMAGDRQAPPGGPRQWQWFRTFSAGDFRGWAARYLWRYFLLLNLFLAIVGVWLVVPALLVVLVVLGSERWGGPAGLGIGCGGSLPVVFSMIVLALWVQLAQADLARQKSGVWIATRRAVRILGRRLGTLLFLSLVILTALLSVAVVFSLLTLVVNIASAGSAGRLLGQLALSVLHAAVTSVIAVAFAATMIGLVRDETLEEAQP